MDHSQQNPNYAKGSTPPPPYEFVDPYRAFPSSISSTQQYQQQPPQTWNTPSSSYAPNYYQPQQSYHRPSEQTVPPQPYLPPQQGYFNYGNTQPQLQGQYYNPNNSYPNSGKQQPAPIPFISPCNGKKKALLIGINYFGQRGKLSGCINDVRNVKRFLIERWGFREGLDSMVVLTDDQSDPNYIPTRKNIINAMHWLVGGVRFGDSLFFHFSGHGGQKRDMDGDEDDGYDETILPVDYKNTGQITDDELHAIMVRPLPAGVRLTAIFDSCHSGTALDLPFVYLPDGRLKEKTLISEAGSTIMDVAGRYMKGGAFNAGVALLSKVSRFGNIDRAKQISQQSRTTVADVISLSGCKDRQTSADTFISGVGSTGAMSYALIKSLSSNPRPTYGQLLGSVREILRKEYSQVPQLSCGKPMDMNTPFLI